MGGGWQILLTGAIHILLQSLLIARVLLREDREPASRIAWMLVIAAIPVAGMVLYLLLGELNIGKRSRRRLKEAHEHLPVIPADAVAAVVDGRLGPLFARAASVNGFVPLSGNRIAVSGDSDVSIDRLVADIDAARDHVHLLFYIWLCDHNGTRVANAVARAARRGVTCRVMVDAFGSRQFARSAPWKAMEAAGVRLAVAFPLSRSPLRPLLIRMDLRNHRKIAVIDAGIGHTGSQNCADAAFTPKPRYAPWVDVFFRIEGPGVWQLQRLFAADWMVHAGEEIGETLAITRADGKVAPGAEATGKVAGALVAGVADSGGVDSRGTGPVTMVSYGTGPGIGRLGVTDVFGLAASLARERLTISTPYYVPTEALQQQIRSAAQRGVIVRLILPARNDSPFVARASRSYYQSLLEAGAEIHEFLPGLLHAKTLTVDGIACVAGSANMDRRSFELNFENNMVVADPALTHEVETLQEGWIRQSRPVTLTEVRGWTMRARLLNNLVATTGPIL